MRPGPRAGWRVGHYAPASSSSWPNEIRSAPRISSCSGQEFDNCIADRFGAALERQPPCGLLKTRFAAPLTRIPPWPLQDYCCATAKWTNLGGTFVHFDMTIDDSRKREHTIQRVEYRNYLGLQGDRGYTNGILWRTLLSSKNTRPC